MSKAELIRRYAFFIVGTFVSALLVGAIAHTFNKQIGPWIQARLSVPAGVDIPEQTR